MKIVTYNLLYFYISIFIVNFLGELLGIVFYRGSGYQMVSSGIKGVVSRQSYEVQEGTFSICIVTSNHLHFGLFRL